MRWFVFQRVAIELGNLELRCCRFVDDDRDVGMQLKRSARSLEELKTATSVASSVLELAWGSRTAHAITVLVVVACVDDGAWRTTDPMAAR